MLRWTSDNECSLSDREIEILWCLQGIAVDCTVKHEKWKFQEDVHKLIDDIEQMMKERNITAARRLE